MMLQLIHTYKRYIAVLLIALLGSCINDDSFFPEETSQINSSTAVVTLLNNLKTIGISNTSEPDCFDFVYPIYLGYNTDSSIRVDSFEGVINIINSQSTNFNITGLQFPFDVRYNNNQDEITISDESDFIIVLNQCNILTLRDEFELLLNKCFEINFPITLINNNSEAVVLNTEDEFESFYTAQPIDWQPQFQFPINLNIGSNPTQNPLVVNTYYEFYEAIKECDRCPEIRFTYELVTPSLLAYQFIAEFPDRPIIQSFNWKINGDVIEVDGSANNGDNELRYNFESPGVYEMCITTETIDCPDGVVYCKDVQVASYCPDLFFEFEQESGTLGYNFTANFNDITDINYQWVVNNEVVEEDGGPNGDNEFFTTFLPGDYEVCIQTETPFCPEGVEYCRIITVEPICPELFFTVEREGNTPAYTFFAEFDTIETVIYDWIVDGEFQETDGGTQGDNIFFFQFEPGIHQVCMVAETSTCPEGEEFCREILVD